MNRFIRIAILNILFIGLLVVSCRPTTEITGTWVHPQVQEVSFGNILVFAMTDRMHIKEAVEQAMADEIRARGVPVSTSLEEFPPRFQNGMIEEKEDLMALIREYNHDAVLTVAVVDERTETRYVPGAGYGPGGFAPMGRFGWYGGFWPYYSHWGPMMYQPGYYEEDRIYFLETNLYDARTEELIWSAQSETVSPQRLDRFSRQFAEITIEEMAQRNLFQPAGTAEVIE